MKKNGFTLAEVLITLAIIGVVAVMTLPALITNTGEQQAKTALKKGINTLTEAAQMNASIAGFDYSSITSSDAGNGHEETQSLYGLLANRAAVDFATSGNSTTVDQVSHQGSSSDSMSTGNYTVFFRDGSSLSFSPANAHMGDSTANKLETDGVVHGIKAIYDTNGKKGPNVLSYCAGTGNPNILGNATDNRQGNTDLENYCAKNKRVIKDQFGVRLRGYYAVPNGAAARWAFGN